MAQENKHNQETMSEDVAQNPGARTAETNQNPAITEEEARNAAAGETPNASGSTTPSTAEDHVPSRSDPEATDLPTSYDPQP
ncbi:hypothetical protein PCC7424_4274 [Gloeothece citriformis PCC 7424]|uniref:Uncharacterized protein n=1 Tax=Gloeothece citriformis (strain PCC 7424) TaxID=65393 RepID=B7K6U4_GLOC7|nr:hypothetical protein [Gloeothece citriformis]ACK72643.1 hypothetical protein PCC7424_4274 [Gloeothece citriformis PCC 7424]